MLMKNRIVKFVVLVCCLCSCLLYTSRTAVQNYNRLKPVVLEGDMYRLVSTYGSNHTSTMYVGKDKDKAAVFACLLYTSRCV